MMFTNSNGILKRKRVGFLLSRRKMRKSIFDTFAHLCEYVLFLACFDTSDVDLCDFPPLVMCSVVSSIQHFYLYYLIFRKTGIDLIEVSGDMVNFFARDHFDSIPSGVCFGHIA